MLCDLWVFKFRRLHVRIGLWLKVVLVHLVVLVPQPREFRLSKAVRRTLAVLFSLNDFLQFLSVRGS